MDSKKQTTTKKQTGKNTSKKVSEKIQLNTEDAGKLKEFLIEELKDTYFAEDEILKGLEKMEEAATSELLKEDINRHRAETQEQIKRLEEVFRLLDQKPAKKKCEAILGILKEGDEVLEDTTEGSMVRDVAIIIASQKVEHYEIATYGSLSELSMTLGLYDVAEILEQTLMEEKSTDLSLTKLAVEHVNKEARSE